MSEFGEFPNSRAGTSPASEKSWERNILENLAYASLKEQRAARRWKYAFRGFIVLYLLVFLYLSFSSSSGGVEGDIHNSHTALIDIKGIIAPDMEANADDIINSLRTVYDNDMVDGLILRFNTPGGSPVQSGIINDEILRLKADRPGLPVYAVIEDVCASGGYYIAVAADEIYADKASIVGSIGVRMDSFGFTEAIAKLGIKRRSLTAGENKAILDPFMPLKEADVTFAKTMLDTVHQQFIDVVKAGRGDKLANDPGIFTGLFWSGEQALPLGLIDGLANIDSIARDKVGSETIIDYTFQPDYFEQFTSKIGTKVNTWFDGAFSSSIHW